MSLSHSRGGQDKKGRNEAGENQLQIRQMVLLSSAATTVGTDHPFQSSKMGAIGSPQSGAVGQAQRD